MSTADDLQRAYQLIREGRADEAEALLLPILQDDPDSVDAWWLMAYALEEPSEVREALNKVLELDPDYSQAPKAREMLAQLDAEHPPAPSAEESSFGDYDDLFPAESTTEQNYYEPDSEVDTFGDDIDNIIFDDGLDDDFTSSLAPPEGMLTAEELFGDADEDIFGTREAEEPEVSVKPTTFTMADIDEPLDNEARAALEERVGRREGRGRRRLIMFLFLLIVFIIPAALIILLLSLGGDKVSDPGPLESITVESQAVNDVRLEVGNQLRPVLGMDSQIVIADSSFGDTFYAKICALPSLEMSDTIWQAMDTVARQAPQLEGELAAVGVSIENCSGAEHDTYYRATVSMADAVRYAEGDFDDDMGRANFQALWKTS